jgi:hypothetical protein
VVKAVPSNALVRKWNNVDLDNPYVVDTTKKLYIGYQLSFTGGAFPFSVAKGNNSKQGWIYTGSSYENVSTSNHVFLIKAVVGSANPLPANEILLTDLDVKQNNILRDPLVINGTVQNLGTTPITSFKINYEINGVTSSDETITGLNILPNTSYNFTYSPNYLFDSTSFNTNISVRVFEPNGVQDEEANNKMNMDIRVFSSTVQRVVLHEVFTSSTCPPCNPGNLQLKAVLDAVNDDTKWACVKYQYNFPSTGDPYYTNEGATRATFYKGISSVPTLFVDGTYSVNPNAYFLNQFKTLAAIPALTTMTASATQTDKTVTLQSITINPVTNMNNPNLRFFAAIVEKKTFKNVKTNDEHEFMYVMKKFMTNVNGNSIGSLVDKGSVSVGDLTYTFNGDYRLPNNANDPINHSIEHSVEDFKALMVVYWLQDIVTKEVFQAGKADPNPGYMPTSIADYRTDNSFNVSVSPNPVQDILHINTDVNIEQVEIYNIQGQLIKTENTNAAEISTMDLSNGLYLLRITSDKGVSTHKFIKQ